MFFHFLTILTVHSFALQLLRYVAACAVLTEFTCFRTLFLEPNGNTSISATNNHCQPTHKLKCEQHRAKTRSYPAPNNEHNYPKKTYYWEQRIIILSLIYQSLYHSCHKLLPRDKQFTIFISLLDLPKWSYILLLTLSLSLARSTNKSFTLTPNCYDMPTHRLTGRWFTGSILATFSIVFYLYFVFAFFHSKLIRIENLIKQFH